MKLVRDTWGPQGIFSTMQDDGGAVVCQIAEHAYQQPDGSWQPKVPPGTYRCVFGQHQLRSGPIMTFEVTGVPGHTGILIHPGNWPQVDSDGCMLPGQTRATVGNQPIVARSELAWGALMQMLGTDDFDLEVA